ncbi:Elongation factor Tu GTP binding domain [Trypanosoma vivax]|uniref:Putative elongation factor 1-alpha n=1 Tax=Trypanosoma vivax (strain Y486) TaxID=1055687 RepID=G0U304_TRYVY|nr:putative elongation factor 1-alpha [Trypanosoma vivax]KAH8604351.1 Elongation factor Tu GTP binding domain [Trypanosoma vivax]CCC50659.1 putative elongation factor 1-alpha [Trypanosoma vivax Y486]
MNRHRKFYCGLNAAAEEEDYDDEYDYDEEEYYEEEEQEERCCNGDAHFNSWREGAAVSTSQANVTEQQGGPFLHEDDVDYFILAAVLPDFREQWNTHCDAKQGLTVPDEKRAVEALRNCNYDVGAAILYCMRLVVGTGRASEAASPEASLPPERALPLQVEPLSAVTTGRLVGRSLKVVSCKKVESGASEAVTNEESAPSPNGPSCVVASVSLKKKSGESAAAEMSTKKQDCTFVVAGHVDAGKSTTLGHLLLLLGAVSQSDVEANEVNGRQAKKESFKYAWLLDHSEEERRRGVTIDAGSHYFETEHRRVHILDAPGHKDYVVSMIQSATQADSALLVVSASVSEFEVGLRHGTREHLVVLKMLGVGSLIVVVNKIDTVNFSKERFDFVVQELTRLLKQTRYTADAIVGFCPVSGMLGTNISVIDRQSTPWYSGPSLVDLINQCPVGSRLLDAPLRLSLQDVQGTKLFCKVECGKVRNGDTLIFMPPDVKVRVRHIDKPSTGGFVSVAMAGDSVVLDTASSLIGLYPGCIGCNAKDSSIVPSSTDFQARVQTYVTLRKPVLPGSRYTMIVHSLVVQVQVIVLVSKMNSDGGWSKGMVKCIPKSTQALIIFRAEGKIALEPAEVCRSLGRFVLQQEGETVGGGLVQAVLH